MSDERVDRVGVEYGRTVNLGHYESERLSVRLESPVSEGHTPGVLVRRLVNQARSVTDAQLERLRRDREQPRPTDEGNEEGDDDDSPF